MTRDRGRQAASIWALLLVITVLLYVTQLDREDEFFYHLDVIFQSLFFIPVVLACLWFGLRGGLVTSCIVVLILIPYVILHWEGLSANDLNRMLQKITYVAAALILGKVIEAQRTEQKRAQDAESLAAIGRSMAAVAHDLKIPLISIGGYSRSLRRHLGDDFPHKDKLDIVMAETRRMEAMVGDMLAFSRPMKLEKAGHEVAEMIHGVFELLKESARGRGVRLSMEAPSHLGTAFLDAMRMKEVMVNLVKNAIEASPEGETVSVRASRRNRRIVLEVIDCGCGIPPEKREEIFLPFYTTKREGMGLGLGTAKKIIEAHEGYLEAENNPGKGMTFRVVIPDPSASGSRRQRKGA